MTAADSNVYFDDSYSELVQMKDGKPVRYCSMAPRTSADEPTLRRRIKELTRFTVRFGEWRQFEIVGRDFDSASEVDLFVELKLEHQ